MIDTDSVHTPEDVIRILTEKRRQGVRHVTVQFAQPRWNSLTSDGVPTLHFDQLNVIAHHLHAINTGEIVWNNPLEWPALDDEAIDLAILKNNNKYYSLTI